MQLALKMEEEGPISQGRPAAADVQEKAGSGFAPRPQEEPALQHLGFSPTMLLSEF